jgi:zinc protease
MTLLVESSDVLPLVDVEVAFPVGSLMDPTGREGLLQLSAHLARRGPRGMSQARFEDELARLGARVSVEVSMRATRVRATVLRRNLEPLFSALAKLLWTPALRQSDFAKLKRQAEAALLSRLDDDQTLGALQFRRALFGGHPYSRPIGGSPSSLASIGLENVKRFYNRVLAPAPFVVGMAGDVERSEAERLVDTYFPSSKPFPKGGVKVEPTRLSRGRRVVIIDKPNRAQTQLFIGTLGVRTRDPNLFPLIVSNTAFGGTFSGPLMQQVRGVRGWSYGAYSRLLHSRQRDAWYMWTAPAAEYSAECAALQLELMERWVDGGISAKELSFAKRYLVNSHCFDRDTPSKRLEADIDVEVLGVPRRYVDAHDELVSEVTRPKAVEATRARIRPHDLVMVVVASAPDVAPAFEALPGVRSVEVVPYDQT